MFAKSKKKVPRSEASQISERKRTAHAWGASNSSERDEMSAVKILIYDKKLTLRKPPSSFSSA